MEVFVSIVTACFNAEEFIAETLESVLKQSYEDWELIVINDGSTDKSEQIIQRFQERDNRVKVINLNKNYGPAYTRNKGIKISQGKYIAFLDSDDVWHKNKLEKQVEFMIKYNNQFSFTGYQKIDEKGQFFGRVITAPKELTYKDLLKSCTIGCLTVMYDQSKIGKYYMPNYTKAQDYALWLNILRDGINAYGLNQTLAYYRIRKRSISRNKIKKAFYQWKIYRTQENLGYFKSLYYMAHYAFHGFLKML